MLRGRGSVLLLWWGAVLRVRSVLRLSAIVLLGSILLLGTILRLGLLPLPGSD